MYLLVCPCCGYLKEVKEPIKMHQCMMCDRRYEPVTKKPIKDTMLTCKLTNDIQKLGAGIL